MQLSTNGYGSVITLLGVYQFRDIHLSEGLLRRKMNLERLLLKSQLTNNMGKDFHKNRTVSVSAKTAEFILFYLYTYSTN